MSKPDSNTPRPPLEITYMGYSGEDETETTAREKFRAKFGYEARECWIGDGLIRLGPVQKAPPAPPDERQLSFDDVGAQAAP